MKLFALDLHQDNIMTAMMDCKTENRKIVLAKYNLQNDELEDFLRKLEKEDVLIVESTTNAFWLYRKIEPLVRKCFVMNTNAVHLRGNKNDRIDAKKLLQILSTFVFSNNENELPSVYIPTEGVTKLRSLFASYGLFMKMETQCKNRIHSLYSQNGKVVTKKELKKKEFRRNLLSNFPLEDFWREQVALLLAEVDCLALKAERLKKDILSLAHDLFAVEIDLLITIPGMSMFTAAAFMSDVCDIARFSSAKKLCAYLKTVPRLKASNTTVHLGPVSKAGRSLTVTLLTQSIPHLKKANPSYAEFYTRLRVGKSAGKCRIALIRKTLTSAFYMLKRNKEFYGSSQISLNRKKREYKKIMDGYTRPSNENIRHSA